MANVKVKITAETRVGGEKIYPGALISIEERTAHTIVGAGKGRWPENGDRDDPQKPKRRGRPRNTAPEDAPEGVPEDAPGAPV